MGTSEEHAKAAKEAMDHARVLAGERIMTDEQFLESMGRADALIDHDIEVCGLCFHQRVMADVAREMLQSKNFENAVSRWSDATEKRWREGKFFKLYQEELKAGRNPDKAFEERGWEM